MYNEKMTLVNGNTIPVLALGTWQTPNEIAKQVVRDAVSVGYRHIDTAIVYENEVGIGEGIKSCGQLEFPILRFPICKICWLMQKSDRR